VYERAAAYVLAGNLDRYLYNELHMKSDLSENNNGLQSPCHIDYRLKLRARDRSFIPPAKLALRAVRSPLGEKREKRKERRKKERRGEKGRNK